MPETPAAPAICPETAIAYRKAGLSYGAVTVFEGLDLDIAQARVTVFCGPNGCGKSTALKALRRLIRTRSGDIFLNGTAVSVQGNKALARQMAMLTQAPSAPEELLVSQLVALGRYAHRRRFSGLGQADREAIASAIAACELEDLVDRRLGALSGGQMQRAWLATVLAQDAPLLLLDEPTNHLDIRHQIETLELVRRLNRERGRTVVLVLHDLNLAARYADEMVMFSGGKVHAKGPPVAVMNEANIGAVFGIDCRVIADPELGRPFCIPYPKA
jgi:iron complex transport system ATP-binding protein